jgi:hypothetical protein
MSTMLPSSTSAYQVCRTGSFGLDCDPETAFPFFSPEGECRWVSGWDPKPVFPDQIAFARDTVFREGKGTHEAVWTVVDVDWRIYRAEYVRLAPASHSAHIIVKVESTESSRSHVIVSYTVTAFGEDAATLVDSFSEPAYAAKMRDWKKRITGCLASR